MGPATQDLILEVLERVLSPFEEVGEILLADRRSRLISHSLLEDPMHVIAQVRDRLRLGDRGDLLQKGFSEVALLVGLVQQEGVRFEVVHRLICLVDGVNVENAALLQLLEIQMIRNR